MTSKQVTTLSSGGTLTISHIMVVGTNKLITCQNIRTHILTSKHVTLSQAMTHSNKSHNGPRSKRQQSQTGPRGRPQIGHKHRPRTIVGSHKRSGHLGKQQLRLGGPECPLFLSSSSSRWTPFPKRKTNLS